MRIQGVLFDMDGVLFDSEEIGTQVVLAISAENGWPVTREMVYRTLGTTSAESARIYRETIGPAFDPERLWPTFKRRLSALAAQGKIPPKPFVRETLCALRRLGVPCAVASSSARATVEAYLNAAALGDAFHAVVSGDMIARSKPAPDIYLEAAARLCADPARCIAVEDAPNGLRAARASGARTVMVPDLIPYTPALAPYCDHVFARVDEILPLLDEKSM